MHATPGLERGAFVRRAVIVIACLMFLSTPLLSEDLEAVPNPIPLCTLVLSERTVEVPVHPYSPSKVILHGNVSIEKVQCIERAIVRISTEIDTGWPTSAEPRVLPFINPTRQRFTISVIVPPGASPKVATLKVIATTEIRGLSDIIVNDTCSIIPLPCSAVTVEAVGSPALFGDDGRARIPVRVWNTGTTEDTYRLELRKDGVLLTGWDGPDRVTVPPRGCAEVNVTLSYSGTSAAIEVLEYGITARRETGEADLPASGVSTASSHPVPVVVIDGRTSGGRYASSLMSLMWPVLVLEITLAALLFLRIRRVDGTDGWNDKG